VGPTDINDQYVHNINQDGEFNLAAMELMVFINPAYAFTTHLVPSDFVARWEPSN
jgi:hypothetical protein